MGELQEIFQEWNGILWKFSMGQTCAPADMRHPLKESKKKVFVFIITRSNLPYPRKERLSSTTVSSASPEVCQHLALG